MSKQSRLFAVTVCAVFAAAALFAASSGKKPVNWDQLPEPYGTPSSQNRPRVIERPDGAGLSLPEGFKVEEFAEA